MIFIRKPLRIKSRDVMMSNLKLDLARSLELIGFCFNMTSINILNLILSSFCIFNVVSCDKCGKQNSHSIGVLCVFPNSKLNPISRSTLKQFMINFRLCFDLMWTLKSGLILNLEAHRGHWSNVTFVTKTLL